MKTFDYKINPFITMHDDAAPEEDEAAKKAAAAEAAKFNDEQQAIFNKALAKQKREFQSKIDDLATKLADAQVGSEAAAKIEAELENVRSTLRTAEEQAAFEKKKIQNEAEQKISTLTEETNRWKTMFTDVSISRALQDAATAPDQKAYNPSQLVQMLRPSTRLVEELDEDKKPTGRLVPVVKVSLPDSDNDGKMVDIELDPMTAVKRMKEAKSVYGNLFEEYAKGGLGADPKGGDGGGSGVDMKRLQTDPAYYRKMRAEGKVPGLGKPINQV